MVSNPSSRNSTNSQKKSTGITELVKKTEVLEVLVKATNNFEI